MNGLGPLRCLNCDFSFLLLLGTSLGSFACSALLLSCIPEELGFDFSFGLLCYKHLYELQYQQGVQVHMMQLLRIIFLKKNNKIKFIESSVLKICFGEKCILGNFSHCSQNDNSLFPLIVFLLRIPSANVCCGSVSRHI